MILDLTNLNDDQLIELNKVPSSIHEDFNQLTEDILRSTRENISDLFSNVVSRHPYQSGLFEICIRLEFIRKTCLQNNDVEKVITDNVEIFKILRKSGFQYQLELKKVRRRYNWIKTLLTRAKNIYRIIVIIVQELLSKAKERRRKFISTRSIILIDSFMLQNSVKEGKYIDRYYSGILNYIEEEMKSRIFFVPHIIGGYKKKNLKNIYLNSEENIIFKHDFLRFIDYFKAIKLLTKHQVDQKAEFFFKGFNITKLIRKSIKDERFNQSVFEALLNYSFIKNLKDEKVELGLLIDWNENQPIDKGLVKGVHDFYPTIQVKGYRAFIISMDYNLYLMPTDYEVANKVIPDEVVVMSNALKAETAKFCKNIRVSTGPAFRFNSIYEKYKPGKSHEKKILIALPIGFEDSIGIIRMISSIGQMTQAKGYTVLIKPHPTIPISKIRNATARYWRPNFKMVSGSFRENILQSFLFISNTSSAIMEALAYGVPTIIIGGRTGVTQNPIPKGVDERIWKLCYNKEELSKIVEHFLNVTDEEREEFVKIGKEIKLNYFEPVTKQKVVNFLNLNQ